MTHGLICCRVQPVTTAHVDLINEALTLCSTLSVMVCSAQEKRTTQNPFSAEERIKMLHNIYPQEVLHSRIHFNAVNDIHNPPKWVDHILTLLKFRSYTNQPVSIYFAGSEEDGRLFAEKRIPVHIRDRKKYPISGTQVRDLLRNGDPRWKNLVPSENWDLIENIVKNEKTLFGS